MKMFKKLQLLLLFAALVVPWISSGQSLTDYEVQAGYGSFTSIRQTGNRLYWKNSSGTRNADDGADTISLPFAFPFGDTTFSAGTRVAISTNGYIKLASEISGATSTAQSSSSAGFIINPFINQDAHMGRFSDTAGAWQVMRDGSGNATSLVIEWFHIASYSTPYSLFTYQLELFPSGNMTLRFDTISWLNASFKLQPFLRDSYRGINVIMTGSWENPVLTTTTLTTFPGMPTTGLPAHGYYYTIVRPTLPSCNRPTAFRSLNTAAHSVQLAWHGDSPRYLLDYSTQPIGNDPTTYTTLIVTDTTQTLSGLNDGTQYYFRIRGLCTDTSFAQTLSVITPCDAVTVPYTDNFDSYAASTTAALSNCYYKLYTNGMTSQSYPYPSSSYHASGLRSLYFYYTTTNTSYFTLPPFQASLNSLTVSFKIYKNSTSTAYGKLDVGVMSDPTDMSTFTLVRTVSASSANSWEDVQVPLTTYTGSGQYIAIRGNMSGSGYAYIDDLSVDYTPSCVLTMSVPTVSNVQAHTATLTWTDASNSRWLVEWGTGNFTRGHGTYSQIVTSPTINITGLNDHTTYNVLVSSLCSNTDTSIARSVSLTTLCDPIALPYLYTFDDATGSSTTSTIETCWKKYYVNGSSYNQTSYPYPSATQRRSGYYGLYFYTTSQTAYSVAILPYTDANVRDLTLSFDLYRTSSNYGKIEVGVVSGENTPTSFTLITRISPTTTSAWQHFDVPLSSYTGSYRYIAMRLRDTASNNCYIDNVILQRTSNTCAAPANLRCVSVDNNSATFTWSGTASSYLCELMTTSERIGEGTSMIVSGEQCVFTGLAPDTYYNFVVRALCGSDTGKVSFVSFKTACQPLTASQLPFIENFDSYTTTQSAVMGCLRKRYVTSTNETETSYPYPSSTQHSSGSYGLYMYSYSTGTSYVTMPLFETAINQLMVSFKMTKTSGSYGYIEVGIMSNPADANTFEQIASYYLDELNTWHEYHVPLSSYTGTGRYITIRSPRGASNVVYIDDVEINVLPSCPGPVSLTVADISDNSALLTWHPGASGTRYIIERSLSPFTSDFDPTNAVTVQDTFLNVTGLTPLTQYYFRVRHVCGNDTTWTAGTSARTVCSAIPTDSLPYIETFDSYVSGSSQPLNPCWTKAYYSPTYNASSYPYPSSSQHHSGSLGVYMYSSTTAYSYFALPRMDTTLNVLQFSIWGYRTATANYGWFSVGVMTNPADPTTFQEIQRVHIEASATWTEYVFSFANYHGAGRYIAVMAPILTAVNYVYLDDAKVDFIPSCPQPRYFEVVAAGDTNTSITFQRQGLYSDYEIEYAPTSQTITPGQNQGSVVWITDTASAPVVTLHNLLPNTQYNVWIKALCNSNEESSYLIGNFRTQCMAVPHDSLPFIDNFESYSTGTTATLSPCYVKNYHTSTSDNALSYPYPSATSPHSGVRNLYFFQSATASSWLSLPLFEDSINHLSVSFWLRKSASNTYHKMSIGVMTDPHDINTFIPITTVAPTPSTSTVYQEFMVDLNNYHGPQGNITFMAGTTGGAAYLYLDDVKVEYLASCMPPRNVRVVRQMADTTFLAWTPRGSSSQWTVEYCEASDTAFHPGTGYYAANSVTVYDTIAGLTGLQPLTTYVAYVTSACGMDESTPVRFEFTTPCATVSHAELPWLETFDNYPGNTSGQLGSCEIKHISNNLTTTSSTPYATNTYTHSGERSLYMYATNATTWPYLCLPMFEDNIRDLEVSMYLFKTSTTATYGTVDVGVMTNPEDTGSFVRVARFTAPTVYKWQKVRVSFAGYTGPNGYLTIKAPYTTNSNYVYVDDIEVTAAGSCPILREITVDSVGQEAVVITLHDTSNASLFYVEYDDTLFTPEQGVVPFVNSSDTSVLITGLTPGTEYHIAAAPACVNGSDARYSKVIVKTECASITHAELPYVNYFDNFTAANSYQRLTPCWHRGYMVNTSGLQHTYPYPSTTAANGGYDIYFYGGTTAFSWLTLPMFEDDVRNLSVTFSLYKGTATYSGQFQVGIMDDPNDTSTFTLVRDIVVSETGVWKSYTTLFADYTGSGRYITLRTPRFSSTNNYLYLDSVVVDTMPACGAVQGTDITLISSDSVRIAFDIPMEFTHLLIDYSDTTIVPGAPNVNHLVITDSVLLLTNLQPNKIYNVAVRTRCVRGDTSAVYNFSFRTPCAPISNSELPYVDNFDSYTATSTATLSPCYYKGYVTSMTTTPTVNRLSYPYPSTTQHASGAKSIYLYSSTTALSYLALPKFDAPLDSLLLTLKVYKTSANYGQVEVGVMTNPEVFSTFVPIDTVQPSALSTWTEFEVSFERYNGSGKYIALRGMPGIVNYAYVDDVEVQLRGNCPRPTSISYDSLSPNGMRLSWTAPTGTTSYRVTYAAQGGTTQSVSVNNATSYILTGLQQNTTYTIGVACVCPDGSFSAYRNVQVNTPCEIENSSMPYVEDFDSYATGSSAVLSSCVYKYYSNGSTTTYPYPSTTYRHSGTNALYGYGSSTTASYFVLPQFEAPLDTLELSVWVYRTSTTATYGTLEIGLMSNPTDTTTFVHVETFQPTTTSTWTNFRTYLPAGYSHGYHIALRMPKRSTAYYTYIDDVTVRLLPSCTRPGLPRVATLHSTSATVEWHEQGSASQWLINYDTLTTGAGTTVIANDTTVTLTGLLPQHTYHLTLRSLCAVGDTSEAQTITFTTPCAEILTTDLPLVENFDTYSASTTAAINPCWYKAYVTTTVNNASYPYPSTSQHTTGSNSMYFYASTTAYSYLVTPAFADSLKNMIVEFDVYRGSTTATYGKCEFGAMSDPHDINTFELIATYQPASSGQWLHVQRALDDYTGTASFLAFRTPLGAANNFYLDAVKVDIVPTCPDVTDVNVTPYVHAASASWTTGHFRGSHTVTNYNISLTNMNDNATVSYTTQDTNFMFYDLERSTQYRLVISASCTEGDNGRTDTTYFTTSCGSQFSEISPTAIPTLTSGTSYQIPVGNYHRYSFTEQLYTAAEIGSARTLTGISFQYNYATATTQKTNCTIYLAHTTQSTLSGWVPVLSMQEVYRGSMNVSQGWNEFDFDAPFQYDGTSNLVLIVHDNSNAYPGSAYTFNVHSMTGKTLYYQSDATAATLTSLPSANTLTYRSNVRFISCDSTLCLPPFLSLNNVGTTSAALHITQGNSETSWIVQARTADASSWQDMMTTTARNFSIDSLQLASTYNVRIGAICSTDTLWSNEVSFTTLCMPTAITATGDYTTATITWSDVCSGSTLWNVEYGVAGFELGNGTRVVRGETPSLTISELTQGLTYDVYVRSLNSDSTALTSWAGPAQFTMNVCDTVSNIQIAVAQDRATADSIPVTVTWDAGTNNSRYEIRYGRIGFVEGEGITLQSSETTVTFNVPNESQTYDLYVSGFCGDNPSIWSQNHQFRVNMVGITEPVTTFNMSIYPNPATSTTTISLTGLTGAATVSVVDLNGRTLHVENVNCPGDCETTLNVDNLAQGVYIVRVVAGSQSTVKRLVVK